MAGATAGRKGHRWRQLHANLKAQHHPCARCGQPIDYRLAWPDPGSFSAGHRLPLSTHPHLAEDPANLQAEHLRCNVSAGAKTDKPTLGATSRAW